MNRRKAWICVLYLSATHFPTKPDRNVYHALPAERWAYFLQNADRLPPEEFSRIFPDKEIAEAARVLEMTSEHLKQLARDIARQKFQRDEEARLIQARLEGEARGEARRRQDGEEIGKARGFKLGRIALLQELLGGHPTTGEEFSGYDETQLKELEERLRQQLGNRG